MTELDGPIRKLSTENVAEGVRDLWRPQDLGDFKDAFEATVAPHGVALVRLIPVP
jgi:alpha-galactosidase